MFLNTDPPFDCPPPYPMPKKTVSSAKFVHNYEVERVKAFWRSKESRFKLFRKITGGCRVGLGKVPLTERRFSKINGSVR